jgi:hypothetical protein
MSSIACKPAELIEVAAIVGILAGTTFNFVATCSEPLVQSVDSPQATPN